MDYKILIVVKELARPVLIYFEDRIHKLILDQRQNFDRLTRY